MVESTEREGANASISSYKDTNPIYEVSTLMTNIITKTSPPNTITLVVRISTHEFGEQRHKLSVHNSPFV